MPQLNQAFCCTKCCLRITPPPLLTFSDSQPVVIFVTVPTVSTVTKSCKIHGTGTTVTTVLTFATILTVTTVPVKL